MTPIPDEAVELAVELFCADYFAGEWPGRGGDTDDELRAAVRSGILTALPAIREAVGREYAGLVEKWRAGSDGERSGPVSYAMRTCADELAALTTTQEARHDER